MLNNSTNTQTNTIYQRMLAVGIELIYLAKCFAPPQVHPINEKSQPIRGRILKFLKENAPRNFTEGQVARAINAHPSTVRRTMNELVGDGKVVRAQERSKGRSALFMLSPPPPSKNPFIGNTGDGMTCDRCGKNGFHKTSETHINGDLVEIYKCATCGFSKRE